MSSFTAFDFYHLGTIQPQEGFTTLDSVSFSSQIAIGLAIEGPIHGMALVLMDRHPSLLSDASIAAELANILGSRACNKLQQIAKVPVQLTAPEPLTLREVETVAESYNQIFRKDFVWKHQDQTQSTVRLMIFGHEIEHQEVSNVEVSGYDL